MELVFIGFTGENFGWKIYKIIKYYIHEWDSGKYFVSFSDIGVGLNLPIPTPLTCDFALWDLK